MRNLNTVQVPAAPSYWRGRNYAKRYVHGHPDVGALVHETGPLAGLVGRNVLTILDVENLTISGRKLGYELDYAALAKRFNAVADTVHLHAAMSVEPGDKIDSAHMERAGFTVHTRVIERLRDGSRAANSDNVLAFQTGLLVSRARADVVLLGSGDGQLICDLANAIRALPRKRAVWTLSLPGATSKRLDCRHNPAIETNVEVGLDVLVPLAPQRSYEP